MNGRVLPLLVGFGLGLVAASFLIAPSDCCDRVAGGVRDKVGGALGAGVQQLGDELGLWKYTPGLLSFFGVGT
jgi:hypothetical protein